MVFTYVVDIGNVHIDNSPHNRCISGVWDYCAKRAIAYYALPGRESCGKVTRSHDGFFGGPKCINCRYIVHQQVLSSHRCGFTVPLLPLCFLCVPSLSLYISGSLAFWHFPPRFSLSCLLGTNIANLILVSSTRLL